MVELSSAAFAVSWFLRAVSVTEAVLKTTDESVVERAIGAVFTGPEVAAGTVVSVGLLKRFVSRMTDVFIDRLLPLILNA